MKFKIEIIAPIILVMAIFWLYPAADLKDPRFSAYIRFAALASILFAVFLWGVNKYVSMFFVLALISSVYPMSTRYSVQAFRYIFIGCAWFYMITQVPYSKIDNLYDAICIIAVLNCIMLVAQYFGHDPVFSPAVKGTTPVTGFLSNKNEASALLAMCLPAFFRDRWKYLIPIVIVGFFVSASSGGFIAALAAALFYLIVTRDKKIWCLLSAMVILGGFYFVLADNPLWGTSLSSRWKVWLIGIEFYKHHPLFGSGIGHWSVVFSQIPIGGEYYTRAHNEFLQALFEMGLIFPIILIGYLIRFVARFDKSRLIPYCAIIAIMVNAFVNFPMHIAQTAAVALTWLGVVEIQNNQLEGQAL